MRKGLVVGDRYRILSPIGHGGMGSVWLASDERIGGTVALKEVHLIPGGEDLPIRRERALREARAARMIDHPSIVKIHDVFLDHEGRPWIVMAYIRGTSLQEMVERGPLAEREVARIGLHVLDALVAAHDAKVVHRDVKPANVVVGEAGQVFLVDFGIAHLTGRERLTSARVIGTPHYLSPEHIGNKDPGPAMDLWALGVTLFNALEGYSPFLRKDLAATTHAITSQPPPAIGRRGPLADAILRLLDKDPETRMTAARLRPVLTSIASGRRAAGPPPPSPPKPPPPPPGPPNPPPVNGLPTIEAVRRVSTSPPEDAARMLAGLPPETARRLLTRVGRAMAGKILLALAPVTAAAIVAKADALDSGPWLDVMASADAKRTASIMKMLSARRAGEVFSFMREERVTVARELLPGDAKRVLGHAEARSLANVLPELPAPDAVQIAEAMSDVRLDSICRCMDPADIAALLGRLSAARRVRQLKGFPPSLREKVERHLRED